MRIPIGCVPGVCLVLILSACGEDPPPGAADSSAVSEAPPTDSSTDGTGPASKADNVLTQAFKPARDEFGVKTFRIVYALDGQTTGVRTMWVEDHGTRVGIEEESVTYKQPANLSYYWDGEQGHSSNNGGDVYSTGLRMKVSEPTSFAVTPAASLEQVGYTRSGEKTVAGRTCEHWKNEALNFEGCRWNQIELEFLNGAGTGKIIQATTATEVVEGEGIPERLKMLAEQ